MMSAIPTPATWRNAPSSSGASGTSAAPEHPAHRRALVEDPATCRAAAGSTRAAARSNRKLGEVLLDRPDHRDVVDHALERHRREPSERRRRGEVGQVATLVLAVTVVRDVDRRPSPARAPRSVEATATMVSLATDQAVAVHHDRGARRARRSGREHHQELLPEASPARSRAGPRRRRRGSPSAATSPVTTADAFDTRNGGIDERFRTGWSSARATRAISVIGPVAFSRLRIVKLVALDHVAPTVALDRRERGADPRPCTRSRPSRRPGAAARSPTSARRPAVEPGDVGVAVLVTNRRPRHHARCSIEPNRIESIDISARIGDTVRPVAMSNTATMSPPSGGSDDRVDRPIELEDHRGRSTRTRPLRRTRPRATLPGRAARCAYSGNRASGISMRIPVAVDGSATVNSSLGYGRAHDRVAASAHGGPPAEFGLAHRQGLGKERRARRRHQRHGRRARSRATPEPAVARRSWSAVGRYAVLVPRAATVAILIDTWSTVPSADRPDIRCPSGGGGGGTAPGGGGGGTALGGGGAAAGPGGGGAVGWPGGGGAAAAPGRRRGRGLTGSRRGGGRTGRRWHLGREREVQRRLLLDLGDGGMTAGPLLIDVGRRSTGRLQVGEHAEVAQVARRPASPTRHPRGRCRPSPGPPSSSPGRRGSWPCRGIPCTDPNPTVHRVEAVSQEEGAMPASGPGTHRPPHDRHDKRSRQLLARFLPARWRRGRDHASTTARRTH